MVNMINPADCDRTTVYTGECRNFADTAWIRFDTGRRRSPDAQEGRAWLIDIGVGSYWTTDDTVRNLVPLVPAPTGGQWTRDDLPSLLDVLGEVTNKDCYDGAAAYRSAALARLNDHFPKPTENVAERERDAWRSEAEFVLRMYEAARDRELALLEAVPDGPPDGHDVNARIGTVWLDGIDHTPDEAVDLARALLAAAKEANQ